MNLLFNVFGIEQQSIAQQSMKQRFSSLDVKARRPLVELAIAIASADLVELQVIAHELNQSLVTLRVANIYDLSSKILLFKFAKPECKRQLVIDSGFRCHLTEFARTTAAAPSAFVARLRKFLKSKRLTTIAQVGTDRILDFHFSDGQYRLFLEFFASGNVILTDAQLQILAIARNVPEGEGQEPQRAGLLYSLDNRQNYHGIPALSKDRVRNALTMSVAKAALNDAAGQKQKAKPGSSLRKCLATSITELPPIVVDHTFQSHGFDTTIKLEDLLENEALLEELVRLLSEARQKAVEITSAPVCTGYIFAKRKQHQATADDNMTHRENLLYEDFHPFIPKSLENDLSIHHLDFQGYNRTVDEFFSSLEGQKLETRLSQREATAKRKLDAARQDQAKRIEGLHEAQSVNHRRAAAIEANVDRVQEAMDAVNGLIAQGMDWVDIGKLVEREKKRKNPVAQVIVLPLKLSENLMTLELAEEEDDAEEDPYETDDSDSKDEEATTNAQKSGQTNKGLLVEINLTISPWSNARTYHEQRRLAAAKEEKTQMQAAKALKSTEQKINEDLRKGLKQEKALLQPIRQPMWFEKFHWFISSDGYLVLGGKDASQNEVLYRKLLRKGDVYCHADLRGAPGVIIKNNPKTPGAPIPPATLSQAGSLSVCSSEAWDSKAGMGAWWVNADQVSKSAPRGEFLPAGSFMVRGSKNFLPPAQLLLGIGVMFRISEESKAQHVRHRLRETNDDTAGDGAVEESQKQCQDGPTVDEDSGDKAEDVMDDVVEQEVGHAEMSDDESEEEREQESSHDNPLQAFGSREDDDGLEAVQGDRAGLAAVDQRPIVPVFAGLERADRSPETGSEDREQSETATEPEATGMTPAARGLGAAGSIASTKKAPPKRGQKGKSKKIANKYKNQDEEDRAAAEALIGAAAGKHRAEAEAKAKAEVQAAVEAAQRRRRAQHQRQQRETAEHEERRRAMMDEDGVYLAEPGDETERAKLPDDFVGTLLPGDEVLEAIPVCAPWSALSRFKYKAKLQPGATKKGKVAKELLERWKTDAARKGAVDASARDAERMWPREVELLRTLKAEDVVNCVPVGKARLVMAGAAAADKAKSGGGRGQAKSRGGRGGKGSKR